LQGFDDRASRQARGKFACFATARTIRNDRHTQR
jgi:hypothetical protein